MLNINGAELGLGEIIICFIVVITVLKAISGVGSWVLDTLNIYTKKRMKEIEAEKTLKDIQKSIESIQDAIKETNDRINDVVSDQKDQMTALKINTRHQIIRSCEQYLDRGYVESYELKALDDLYESYINNLNGNSYAKDMMKNVRSLEVKHIYKNKEKED